MGPFEFILFPLYLLFFHVIFSRVRKKYDDPVLRKYHRQGFWIKVLGTIAFTVFNPLYRERPAYDVYLAATDGSGRQILAPRRRQPQFSPDGSRLVVMGMENEREKLFVRDLVNGGERPVNNTPIESMQPSWSPEGGEVVRERAETAWPCLRTSASEMRASRPRRPMTVEREGRRK